MNTNFDDATHYSPENEDNFNTVEHQEAVVAEEGKEREIPWKQLSIGGAFGLLLGGGSLYATGAIKANDDSDALMAGAEAGGEINVDSLQENNDPVLLDENGNPITPPRQSDKVEASSHDYASQAQHEVAQHEAARSQAEEAIRHSENHESHARSIDHDNSIERYQESSHPHLYVDDTYHAVNILDMDDNLSFSEAFAQARAELGAGGAFYWRGGVFGTYYQNEWNSMSPSEQAEFSQIAMNTAHHNMDELMLAHQHSTVHFYEGDVIDLDTGNPYIEEAGYIMGDPYDNNEVEIIDSIDLADNNIHEVVDFKDSMEDLLSDFMDEVMEAGSSNPDSAMGDIATLIHAGENAFASTQTAINDISELIHTVEDVFDTTTDEYNYSTDDAPSSFDDIPDYVSDADTVDIV